MVSRQENSGSERIAGENWRNSRNSHLKINHKLDFKNNNLVHLVRKLKERDEKRNLESLFFRLFRSG